MRAPTRSVLMASCVGGGPLGNLARALEREGIEAEMVAGMSPDAWRRRMAGGRAGRLWARLAAVLIYPALALRRARRGAFDVAVVSTNPFFAPHLFTLFRWWHRAAVVALVYDLYPDAAEVAGRMSRAGCVGSAWTKANRWLFRHADAVVFIGANMGRHARARYGEPRRWTVIETGASAADAAVPDRAARDLDDWCGRRPIASYVGNLGLMHDWATAGAGLAAALEAAPAASAPLGVVIAASGPGVADWRQALEAAGRDRVRFEPPLDDAAWAWLLGRTDVALVTLRREARHTSVPSKVWSAMAAGCAVLAVAPAESDLAAAVARHGCGIVVEPGDAAGFRRALEGLLDDPGRLARMKRAARDAVRERHDMSLLAARWAHLLESFPRPGRPRRLARAVKRAGDVIGASLGLLAAAPVMLLAAIAVLASLGAPVLFRQTRPGRDGRPFTMLKLRTMRAPRAGEDGPEHDALRLTRVGRLLRSTSVDELPSLWNVVRGEMSLVGPRPLLTAYLDRYTARQARRHEVKPGITGWAQVHGRNAVDWSERLDLDVWYVEHWSLALDLEILWRTARTVLRRTGISRSGHATMPEFTGRPEREWLP